MALSSNKLTKQVDLPVWEWTRPLPVAATAGLSCVCNADNVDFNDVSGRYIYMLLNATNFWRYDTIADTYLQLASPGITPATASSMQFAGAQGYYGRVISGTSTTITTGLPNKSAIGFRIRIVSGKGAGQERIITDVSEPIVADWGGASAGAAGSVTDSTKAWTFNNWIGYVVRTTAGTGLNQVRKILYNTNQILTVGDANIYAYENMQPLGPGVLGFVTTPAAGTQYQIEASVITVDTAWSVTPDDTSRYVIQSGGIWLASGAAVAAGGLTMQYYSVLEDVWYGKAINNSMIPVVASDMSLERFTENSSIWYTGKATTGNTTTLTDATASWTSNQWQNYKCFIWTGTGKAQLANIANNTQTQLTFSSALGTGLDSTSRYNILGYDAGTLTSTEGRILFDTSKNWDRDRWSNYAIRIIAGTGDGQMRQIMSNGKDSIVVYEPWNVQPDNTSIYAIQAYTSDMLLTIGGNSETFLFHADQADLISHGRILDEGVVQAACAIPVDGTSTASHVVFEQKPVAISALSGTSTITANTPQAHTFKIGQWVSVRGVTSGAADIYNVTGKVQVATIPASNQFTYTPFAAGTGTYQFSNNVTISTTVVPDASKHFADLATGGSTTSVTFSRATPTNINGWYAYGANVAAGAQVANGAGTTTLNFNLTGAGTPGGTIVFTKWPQPVTLGTAGGGGAGVFTATSTSTIPAYTKGWLTTATNVGLSAYLTGGEGTTTGQLSIQAAGAVSGTFTLSYQLNNLLPTSATYSANANTTSISFTANTQTYINGWFLSGTGIGNGSRVISGEGSNTLIVSTPHASTPSGTITFYPPTQTPVMFYGTTAAPAVNTTTFQATGTAMQLIAQNTLNGSIITPLAALAANVSIGVSRYVIAKRDMIGQHYANQNLTYLSGVALGTQSASALVDTNAFWATATGSGGGAGQFTFTISAIGSPIHNGWYVSGTGIPAGARVVSGGGTTSITIDLPMTAAASGTITFTAWQTQNLAGRRIRVLSSTGVNQDVAITTATPTTGTLTTTITAVGSGSTTYAILPSIVPGVGTHLRWNSNSTVPAYRGRFAYRFRGGAAIGVDRIDLTNDLFYFTSVTPNFETLGSGSSYAYDGLDRIYFTKDVTNRVYYLDITNNMIYGAGLFPYLAGTAGIGNMMEIFKTADGIKYVWVNRKAAVETFRQLVFY